MKLKFRIWDRQARRYVENSCSLHCYSNWQIDAFTGEISDFVGSLFGDDSYSRQKNPDWYMDGVNIVNGQRYFAEQWTGEVDEKGVDIYDGDIVEYQFANREPVYRDKIGWEACSWRMISLNGDSSDAMLSGMVTVIGNVNENPELLK